MRMGTGIEPICHLCGHPIASKEQVAKRHGNWIHRSCAPGQDEGER